MAPPVPKRLIAVVAAALSLLAACTSLQQSEPDATTTVPHSPPCESLTDVSPRVSGVREDVAAGEKFWVVYGVVRNDCAAPVTLARLHRTAEHEGQYLPLTGRTGVAPVGADGPWAIWAPGEAPQMQPVANYQVQSRAVVQVAAEVRQRPGADPHSAPPMRLDYDTSSHPQQLNLWPDIALCSCTHVDQ